MYSDILYNHLFYPYFITLLRRVKTQAQRAPGYDQILKKNEQLYALLAITSRLEREESGC